tara:strand:- start:542 stop:1258 length:717 start_codon:yes stop_codon:yes gene_type:complete
MNAITGSKYHVEYGNNVSLVPGMKDKFDRLGLATHLGIKLAAKHKSVEGIVKPQIERIQSTTEKVRRLASDLSRNPTQRHLVAQALAKELDADLRRTHDRVAGIADDMIAEAESGIHKVLGTRADNGWMYASAFQWFREVGTDAIGLKNISEAVREDLTLAQAVFNGPRQIMGFGKDTHMTMREGIAKKWVRDEWAQLNEGLDVQKSLSNYMPLIGDIHGAYYNPAVIEQSDASRVDV